MKHIVPVSASRPAKAQTSLARIILFLDLLKNWRNNGN